jgi:hypothetical protein
MNIKSILIGSLAVGLAVGGSLLMNNQEENSSYAPRLNADSQSNEGRAEYMHMLRQDPATGLVDQSLVNQARNEVISRSKTKSKSSLGMNWIQQGPDNVGGRTRALLIDRNNSNVLYAGSVTGGLFVSTNEGINWTPVSGMQGVLGSNLAVSCITQTANGRIFFGTGATFESGGGNGGSGAIGNGVYEYVPSSGAVVPVITNSTAVPNNNSNSFWSATNAIASYGNRLYLGTRDGMVWADPNGSGIYPTTISGWTNPIYTTGTILETNTVQDIDVASDGSMLVCFGGKAYISNQTDAVGSFTKKSFSGSRLSGAIAPSNPNVMYILGSSGVLAGLSITIDKGASWDVIVPPGVSTGTPSSKDPFVQNDGTGGQGGYDDAIAVNPGDWGHIIVGGVQLYEWKYNAGSNPIGGSWLRSATLFELATNPYYVHADKHTIVWKNSSTVYIGSDGGIARSADAGETWQARNYGYNVTTFYDMNISASGYILGGAQDNGCQLVTFGDFGELTPLGSVEIQGGDGFDVAFSNFGTGIAYATSQFGSLTRSSGGAGGSFYSNDMLNIIASNTQPFHTVLENWENKYDLTSIDSVSIAFDTAVGTIIKPATFDASGSIVVIPADTVFAGETIFAGDTIYYNSSTNNLPLQYVVPTNIVLGTPVDTLKLQDPIQNKFVTRLTSSDPDERGIYLTQDAARLNALSVNWFRIAPYSDIENFEFSPTGNDVFLGSSTGKIYRVSGLNSVTSKDDQATWDANLTITEIATGLGGVVSMAVDPNDGNNVIATSTGYTSGNHVYRATDALTATSNTTTFAAIQGVGSTGLPKMPVYDAEVALHDNNQVVIGTEWGVWTTDNAFSAASGSAVQWTDESGNGMSHVPVFAVEQQRLDAWESVNSGVMYLGTHGRGFYKSTDLPGLNVAVDETESEFEGNDFASSLSVYPNPLNNSGTLTFKLRENVETTIRIYNLTGSLVRTIELGVTTKGEHKERFDASTLSVGSYIISLESGSERKVAKFIVTR